MSISLFIMPDQSVQNIATNVPPPLGTAPFPPLPPIDSAESPPPPMVFKTDETPPPITPGKKGVGKKTIATILGLILLIGGVATGVILVQQRQELREKAQVAPPTSACQNGSFTTSGGYRYCFAVDNSIKKLGDAKNACKQYGSLASFLDGETKQDVLDVISRFKQDKSQLYQNTSGGDPDDGAYFADSCDQFTDHYGNNDTSLYWGDPEGSGKLDCSQQPLSFGRSNDNNGRVNDTKDGNGRGAVCELAVQASPTSTATPSSIPTATPTTGPTATPTATPTSPPGATATPRPTATPTPAPRVTPTPEPQLPDAGSSLPALIGAGIGVIFLIAASILAF